MPPIQDYDKPVLILIFIRLFIIND